MADKSKQRTVANRLMQGLAVRSLPELRQQWMNLVGQMAKWQGKTPPRHLLEFQVALQAEWERRCRTASQPSDYFRWPSTAASGGDGSLDGRDWNREGLLSFLGYRVGATAGLTFTERQYILDAIQCGSVPPVNDPSYMREWGTPSSSNRLRKLANELASFARNAKRNRSLNLENAIADWETDLQYLFNKYYVRQSRFV